MKVVKQWHFTALSNECGSTILQLDQRMQSQERSNNTSLLKLSTPGVVYWYNYINWRVYYLCSTVDTPPCNHCTISLRIKHEFFCAGKIPLRQLVYRVLDLPPSMRPLVYDFGQLNREAESKYIEHIVKDHVKKNL